MEELLNKAILGDKNAFSLIFLQLQNDLYRIALSKTKNKEDALDAIQETMIITYKNLNNLNSKSSLKGWIIKILINECYKIHNKKNKTKILSIQDSNFYENIKLELDLSKAVGDADLIIESMAENVEQKIDIYKKMADLLPEKTVIVTNSSTLLPSKFAKYTKRPNKYLSLHFANSIWKNNMTEVMAQKQTNQKYFDLIMDFAKEIRMIPLPVRKEKSGYLLNSMLVPLLFSGMDLYVNGISDPESIDKAWTLGTGAPKGPFQILDTVGLTTAYNIVSMYLKVPSFLAPYNFKGMAKMLKKYIDEGKLGMSSGEGFYKY